MKVVIFCGGLGVRMGEETQRIPKPMIKIGGKPILWHIMRVLRGLGPHRVHPLPRLQGRGDQGVLPLLQRGAVQRLRARAECATARIELLSHDIAEWRITFVDTGINSTIGERLKAVEPLHRRRRGLPRDLRRRPDRRSAPRLIETFHASDRTRRSSSPCDRSSTPISSSTDADGTVLDGSRSMSHSDVRINGGFFVFKREILDLIEPGDELVEETFARLIERRELIAYPYEGFFGPMDTIKDRQRLEALHESGGAPWRRAGHERLAEHGTG